MIRHILSVIAWYRRYRAIRRAYPTMFGAKPPIGRVILRRGTVLWWSRLDWQPPGEAPGEGENE